MLRKILYIIILLTLPIVSMGQKSSSRASADEKPEELSAYFEKCDKARRSYKVMAMADTLRALARKYSDEGMECTALCFKARYYIYSDRPDSLDYYINQVQLLCRQYGIKKHYYWIWGQKIEHLLAGYQIKEAMDELEVMLKEAEAENAAEGKVQAYKLLGQAYSMMHNREQAFNYFYQLLQFLDIHKEIEDVNHIRYYCLAADELALMKQFDKAFEYVGKAKKMVTKPSHERSVYCQEGFLAIGSGNKALAKQCKDRLEKFLESDTTHLALAEFFGLYYQMVGDYKSMLQIAEGYERATGDTIQLMHVKYQALLHIPERVEEGAALANRYFTYVDSIQIIMQDASVASQAVRMNMIQLADEAEELRHRTSMRFAISGLVLIILLAAVSILLIYMNRRLKASITQLRSVTHEKEVLVEDVSSANEIQMNLLNHEFPHRPDLDLHAFLRPAKLVGGDIYDFMIDEEDKLYFILGDVSGKGVPASLIMAITISAFRSYAKGSERGCQIMRMLNHSICQNNKQHMFVTLISGVLDLKTGRLNMASSGHMPPLYLKKRDDVTYDVQELQVENGVPLGLMPDYPYECTEIYLQPGDKMFLYTDGLTEAENEIHIQYGEDRLKEMVTFVQRYRAEAAINYIVGDVKIHAHTAEQSDDIAVMAFEYKGRK